MPVANSKIQMSLLQIALLNSTVNLTVEQQQMKLIVLRKSKFLKHTRSTQARKYICQHINLRRKLHFLITEIFKSVSNLNRHFIGHQSKTVFPIRFKEGVYIAPSPSALKPQWNQITLIRQSLLEQVGGLFWNNLLRT